MQLRNAAASTVINATIQGVQDIKLSDKLARKKPKTVAELMTCFEEFCTVEEEAAWTRSRAANVPNARSC